MKHLRYLDISKTGITTLPDFITKLYNLIILRVADIEKIPKGFVNLTNLRHFYFNGILDIHEYLLPGTYQGCQIEELGCLHNLRGEIEICGLQNLSSYKSATKANLFGKSNIQSLKLVWEWEATAENMGYNTDVVEGLRPH
ncbi:hypothetical protein ACH5RR_028658 [Cinchona calisaya]|uniref:R13L1/DRL21-like LRR repeat region domain-containing protein n=1 Tax=Cinchona calisaya TaxID=153742 RepID=A0ABD2YSR2_9GENT